MYFRPFSIVAFAVETFGIARRNEQTDGVVTCKKPEQLRVKQQQLHFKRTTEWTNSNSPGNLPWDGKRASDHSRPLGDALFVVFGVSSSLHRRSQETSKRLRNAACPARLNNHHVNIPGQRPRERIPGQRPNKPGQRPMDPGQRPFIPVIGEVLPPYVRIRQPRH